MFRTVLGIAIGFLLQSGNGFGQYIAHVDSIHTDSLFGELSMHVQIPMGQTFIKSAECGEPTSVRYHLPKGKAQPFLRMDTFGLTLRATIAMTSPGHKVVAPSVPMRGSAAQAYQVSGSMTVDDDPAKYLTEVLPTTHTPISLDLKLGVGSVWLDLTDLEVKSCNIVSGSADVFLSYKRPVVKPVTFMRISSGMSRITIRNLEYARAKTVKVENGMGDTQIFIGKDMRSRSNLRVKVGAGTCSLLIHEQAPFKLILVGNIFSSPDIPKGLRKLKDNEYTSLTYGKNSKNAMIITVNLGIGSFSIETYKEDVIPGND